MMGMRVFLAGTGEGKAVDTCSWVEEELNKACQNWFVVEDGTSLLLFRNSGRQGTQKMIVRRENTFYPRVHFFVIL